MTDVAEIGVLGGSGLYALLEDAHEVQVDTPYGAPSAPVVVGEVLGRSVAFFPRHGLRHEHPPHRMLLDVVVALPAAQGDCPCSQALDGLHLDPALP